jgi:hypothetical protein
MHAPRTARALLVLALMACIANPDRQAATRSPADLPAGSRAPTPEEICTNTTHRPLPTQTEIQTRPRKGRDGGVQRGGTGSAAGWDAAAGGPQPTSLPDHTHNNTGAQETTGLPPSCSSKVGQGRCERTGRDGPQHTGCCTGRPPRTHENAGTLGRQPSVLMARYGAGTLGRQPSVPMARYGLRSFGRPDHSGGSGTEEARAPGRQPGARMGTVGIRTPPSCHHGSRPAQNARALGRQPSAHMARNGPVLTPNERSHNSSMAPHLKALRALGEAPPLLPPSTPAGSCTGPLLPPRERPPTPNQPTISPERPPPTSVHQHKLLHLIHMCKRTLTIVFTAIPPGAEPL